MRRLVALRASSLRVSTLNPRSKKEPLPPPSGVSLLLLGVRALLLLLNYCNWGLIAGRKRGARSVHRGEGSALEMHSQAAIFKWSRAASTLSPRAPIPAHPVVGQAARKGGNRWALSADAALLFLLLLLPAVLPCRQGVRQAPGQHPSGTKAVPGLQALVPGACPQSSPYCARGSHRPLTSAWWQWEALVGFSSSPSRSLRASCCLFWCLGWGSRMWEKFIFQPGQIMKILLLL